jgi:hypothetical protein
MAANRLMCAGVAEGTNLVQRGRRVGNAFGPPVAQVLDVRLQHAGLATAALVGQQVVHCGGLGGSAYGASGQVEITADLADVRACGDELVDGIEASPGAGGQTIRAAVSIRRSPGHPSVSGAVAF